MACGIFLDRGLNPCSLHWQADSYSRHPQGSPEVQFHPGLPSLSAERLWQVIQTCSLSIFFRNIRATLANVRQIMLSWDKWVRHEWWELASLGSPGQLTWWRWALFVDFQGCTFFFFFFLSKEFPKEEGLTDVSYSLGPFAGDGTAGFMKVLDPKPSSAWSWVTHPLTMVFLSLVFNSTGLGTPLAIPAAVPPWTVGWVTSVACMTLALVMVADMSGHLHVTEKLTLKLTFWDFPGDSAVKNLQRAQVRSLVKKQDPI